MRFSRQEYWSGLSIFINIHNVLPQGDNLLHPPVKEVKLTHPPRLRLAVLGDICKDWTVFLLCILTSHHLWSIKEPGIQAQTRWLFWGPSLLSSGSAGSRIKSLPCLNRFLGSYWLLMQWAERAWTCNKSASLISRGGLSVETHLLPVYGNPLQYSSLKHPMDRGAWQAI